MSKQYKDKVAIGDAVLYLGDCKKILPTLEGIDMVFTDPPYGVNYEGGHNEVKREKLVGDNTDVYSWAVPTILNATSGPCYCFFADSRAYNIYKALTEAKADIHALLIWHKTNATYGAMNSQYKQRHEPILYFKRKGGNLKWVGKSTESTLLNFPRDASNNFHPTQKPVGLLQHLINNHDAETVCDPYSGSGSCGIASIRAERKFIGIEIDEGYFKIACERIKREYDQLKMF